MNKILQEDIHAFVQSFALADDLQGSSFLITGATGLIGSCLIRCLLAMDRGVRIVAPVRNRAKAEAMFEQDTSRVEWIVCDLATYDYTQIGYVDYIVHCAAPTNSKYMVDHPVETYRTIHDVTARLLDYAKAVETHGMVYVSSLEVYGAILDDHEAVTESVQGYVNPLKVRSSYTMGKRAAETLCYLYSQEYGVPVRIARLTQTTGAGVGMDDKRIIVDIARKAVTGEDIVLHTEGRSAKPYCYTTDAISAILYMLLCGENGAAYNVANDSTYIGIRDMGEYVRDNFNPFIAVRVERNDQMGYAPETRLKLDISALKSLGWQPKYGLKEIFERLIAYLSDEA